MPIYTQTGRLRDIPSDDADGQARVEKFLRTARERFTLAMEAESLIRAAYVEDLAFYSGDQWPSGIVEERRRFDRPCLTINRLPQFCHQVMNEQRQARPQIQINPKGGGATVDTATILQGLTRHIEVSSDAEIAYDTAFQCQVIGGFGYFRVLTEFVDQESMDQEIRIRRILNPCTVYFDPTCQEPDYSDAEYAFIIHDLTKEEYKDSFPNSKVAGLSDFRSIGDDEREWFQNGGVRIAEYFPVEKESRKLVQLADGRVVFDDELPENAVIEVANGEPITREVQVRRVRWAKINAREILEETDWLGKWIPIIPVLGEELIVSGKRQLSGVVRHAKGSQQQYNYQRTALVETIALAPKAPWVAEEGQLEGHEEIWETSNRRNWAVLPYKGKTDTAGHALPAPQRNYAEPPIAAVAQAVAQADNDLKSTTGIYDPSLGVTGPQQSGRAIGLLQKQGGIANFGYIDNLSRAIRHLGRLLVDLAPKIYNQPGRVIRIVKPDQTHELVTLNQPFEEKPGVMKIYDLNVGKYDVTVSVGPGYESKRQEFVASVLQLVQSAPQIGGLIMDLVVRNMDWPGATEIAERLKKMLPAELQDQQQTPGQAPIPPEFQQKMEALLQQQAALTEQLNQATSVIENRRMEMESRERIAAIQAETQLTIAQFKADSAESIELLRQRVAAIDKRLELLHVGVPVEEDMPGGTPEEMRLAA
jgi:hypothetical protein